MSLCVRIGVCCLLPIFIFGCSPRKSRVVWDKNFFRIGSQSSPRTADLNGDGVLDIIMGAGQNEYQESDQGIIAIDGQSGEIIWQQHADDQVFASATLYDVNRDGVVDVLIGGRYPHLKALDGKTGEVLWEYHYTCEDDPILCNARFNFYNSVLVPDQNGDGLLDLLTVNGGNHKAKPYDSSERVAGVLMVFDSRTGAVLAADTMPDGHESYMSPLCFLQPDSDDPIIVFGSGGETISGHLYLGRLSDLMNRHLSNAKVVASEKGHGFVAPVSAADINGDGYLDIVAISHASLAVAIDGKSQALLWSRRIANTECSNSFAVGYFTDDRIPDFFTFVSKGQWPGSTGSLQIMLDGKDGHIAYKDSIGCTGFSSPVVYDLNGDGFDEGIISINEFDCSLGFGGTAPNTIQNKLLAMDFHNGRVTTIDQTPGFKNIFSTPWVGDLDDDGYLDIIHCQYFHRSYLLSFLGMRIKRISTPVRAAEPARWGAYMGTRGDGVFLASGKGSLQ